MTVFLSLFLILLGIAMIGTAFLLRNTLVGKNSDL